MASASLLFGQFNLIGEYITTLRSFDMENLSFNDHGAHPAAMHLEVFRTLNFGSKPGSIGVAYGHSWQSLALGIPEQSIFGVINVFVAHGLKTVKPSVAE